jgi:hypothetical protein
MKVERTTFSAKFIRRAKPLGPITDRDWMLFDLFSAGRLITDEAWMRVPESWQREAIASGTVITFRARAGSGSP